MLNESTINKSTINTSWAKVRIIDGANASASTLIPGGATKDSTWRQKGLRQVKSTLNYSAQKGK